MPAASSLRDPPSVPAAGRAGSPLPLPLLPLSPLPWMCGCNYSADEDPISPGSCSNYHSITAQESWSSGPLGFGSGSEACTERKGLSPPGSPSPPPEGLFPCSEASLGTYTLWTESTSAFRALGAGPQAACRRLQLHPQPEPVPATAHTSCSRPGGQGTTATPHKPLQNPTCPPAPVQRAPSCTCRAPALQDWLQHLLGLSVGAD